MIKRWSRDHKCCLGCGQTIRPHYVGGRCKPCYTKFRRINPAKHEPKKWSKLYDDCAWCGTTEIAHAARGLCVSCYGDARRTGGLNDRSDLAGFEDDIEAILADRPAVEVEEPKFPVGRLVYVLYAGFWCKGHVEAWLDRNLALVRLLGGTKLRLKADEIYTSRPVVVI